MVRRQRALGEHQGVAAGQPGADRLRERREVAVAGPLDPLPPRRLEQPGEAAAQLLELLLAARPAAPLARLPPFEHPGGELADRPLGLVGVGIDLEQVERLEEARGRLPLARREPARPRGRPRGAPPPRRPRSARRRRCGRRRPRSRRRAGPCPRRTARRCGGPGGGERARRGGDAPRSPRRRPPRRGPARRRPAGRPARRARGRRAPGRPGGADRRGSAGRGRSRRDRPWVGA